jgi:Ca2+-binding RTX toxin-like protein
MIMSADDINEIDDDATETENETDTDTDTDTETTVDTTLDGKLIAPNQILGTSGQDLHNGSAGSDLLYGNKGDDMLYGNDSVDWLYGGKGNDLVDGGAGADHLNGDLGDDTYMGGGGADRFIFAATNDADTVLDFDAGEGDLLVLSALRENGAVSSVEDILARAANDAAGDAVLNLGDGNSITLVGVDASSLSASHFELF